MAIMMNPGVHLAIAMWVLTALSLILVALRLYTRIYVVKFVGAEDHMYFWTGVSCFVRSYTRSKYAG
jgi:hypothetical protein